MKFLLLFVSLLLPFESVLADTLVYNSSLNRKTIKPKKGLPTACFYFTVTTGNQYSNATWTTYPDFVMQFQNVSSEVKYSYAEYSFYPSIGKHTELKFENEYGKSVEACVVPGEYTISAVAFVSGICAIKCSVMEPKDFKPISFSLKENSSIYLGNFFVVYSGQTYKPGMVIVRNQFARDLPFIIANSKNVLSNSMEDARINTGSNTIMVNEK